MCRGEVRVIRRGDPVGEHLAAVLAFAVRRLAAEEFRRDDAVAHGVLGFAAAAVEDDRLARIFAGLAADLGEEGDEAAVVIHRPAVERMVVALRALDADAEEGLRGVFRELQRIGLELVVIDARAFESWSRWRR